MRQRKLKNLDERLAVYSEYMIDEKDIKNLKELSEGRRIYLEIGCGKGRFINSLALRNPDDFFIGIEGHESVMLRALEKAEEGSIENVRFFMQYIRDLSEVFPKASVDGIYLNFSDPWPKDRHAKRRLTHARFLKTYEKVLKSGGFVAFKTDNDSLFEFSMEEIEKSNFEVLEMTRDLHGSEYAEGNIMTEYEEKFSKLGEKINYVKMRILY